MAGSTRFELASSSPEGSSFTGTYPNGQRGTHAGANLDRSGSFRESTENRMLVSGSGTSRGGALSMEMPPLAQNLMLEQFSMSDQKFTRSGELRRALGVSLGTTLEDHSFGGVHSKPLPPVATEDLKRFKASVLDTSIKARDRAKMLDESIGKLDKYRHILLSRKRQRNEVPSSERSTAANMLKMGSQINQNLSDLVTQRLEDRTKNAVPNKRVRTSVAESEGRSAALSRPGLLIDKDKDMPRASNGVSLQVEDKIRGLPTGGDGWEKKMTRKRSVGAVVTRTMDGDREIKRGMQQRLNNESRSRSSEGHGFRSGASNGTIGAGINKLDSSSLPTSSSARATPRNDQDIVSLPNDRRDRAAGFDKDRAITKGNNKINLWEDNQVGGPTPVMKGKASRAPRTGSGMLVNSSSNFPKTSGTLDGWEQAPCSNKIQPVSGANNRKRPMPTGSSSPPVAQWVGQRPQKISRTRRTNLVSPVSNHEEAHIPSEGFPASDIGARLTATEGPGHLLSRGISNNTQQFKLKLDNVPSPAGLSESEGSGAGDYKSKDKGMDNGEIEERAVNAVQKVSTFMLPNKKKSLIKDEIGDGVRRQGRSGRVSAQSRACMPLPREKLENSATTKPLRSTKPGSDKSESKSGRPPAKKLSDRKAFARPGHAVNSVSSEFTGESDDDHEELLAAANSAPNASYDACSGSFWKRMEPIFAFVNSDDIDYLKQHISFVEEFDRSLCHLSGADHNETGEFVHKAMPSTQAPLICERQGSQPNGIGLNQSGRTASLVDESCDAEMLCGKLECERWFEKIIPLSQRLLEAFIVEDETEEFDLTSERKDALFQYMSDDSPCGTSSYIDNDPKDADKMESEIESEVDLKTQRHCPLDSFSCDGSIASNNFRSPNNNFRSPNIRNLLYSDDLWQEDESLGHSEVGVVTEFGQNHLDQSQQVHSNFSSISSSTCHYEQMCLDDRILLELQSIGLFPETVPDLTEGEDEEINKDISELKKRLYQQVSKKKVQLCKLEKAVKKGREMEERYLEQLAMNKLVEMAYKKYMACRGNNASKNKSGVNKVSKQAALAFVKRALARCCKFEDTGKSCFSEPALWDVISSAPLYASDSKFVDRIGAGEAANPYSEVHNCQPESRASGGVVSSAVERHGSISGKFERSSSDAFQAVSHSSDQTFAKQEPLSNRGKKREVLLDDVGVSVSRVTSTLVGNTLSGGAKGKRSERDRDQNKDVPARSSGAKAGRPIGNFKGERKTKTKPKQKTAQLSTSGNGLLGRFSEATDAILPSARESRETGTHLSSKANGKVGLVSSGNVAQGSSKEIEEPIDLTNLPLPGIDGQDFSSWLNFDDDGLQEQDLMGGMGLEIPMDDLNMII
ncbi:uncharacterized protein LOC143881849 isoform X2 [Tasmannia lanceolata]|uniref:uncharacterized protein LOC143881849 isoform X2 n=1 Tax=Tasmannia lanceolata TaxID=3420 RepID=UPI004062DEF0